MTAEIRKLPNFTVMATLARYTTFKGLKESTSGKRQKSTGKIKNGEAGAMAFFKLLIKAKVKAKKA